MSEGAARTILLVEDEAIIAMATAAMLRRRGFSVAVASSGEAAVEAATAGPCPDLVLMDINLGEGMDGTEAATRILARRDLPLVFLSSHTEPEVVERTEGITSYGYIVKNSGETVLMAALGMAFKLYAAKLREAEKSRALELSEGKFRTLVENSHDVIYTLDREGLFTFVSPAWTALLGRAESEAVGASFERFVHPDDLAACRDWLRMVLETGTRRSGIQYRVMHADGSWRWHSSSAMPVRDASGAVIGYEGVSRDITEARRVEDALAFESSMLRAIFDSVPGLLYLYDSEGRLRRWNRRHETMTGYGPEELAGMGLMDWYPDDEASRRAVAEGVERTMRDGFGEAEAMLRRKDGSLIPMYFTASRIDIRGELYFAGIGLDLGERRRAERAMATGERNLHTLFDAIDESVALMERDGTVVECNRVFAARLGLSVEECAGRNAFDLVPAEVAARRRPILERVLATGVPETFEDERSGRFLHQVVHPVPGEGGAAGRVVIFASDVTPQRRALESLKVSETLYRTLFDVAPVGITISDDAGRILKSNRIAEAILGLRAEEHEGRAIDGPEWRILRPDGTPMQADEFPSTRALREGGPVENVIMGVERGGGGLSWISVSAAPVPLDGYGVAIAYADVSGLREAEGRIEALLHEKELLLRETHHRIKNNIGTVISLLMLQAAETGNDEARTAMEGAAGRLESMMVLYDRLYHSEDFGELDAKGFLESLMGHLAEALGCRAGVNLSVEPEGLSLCSKVLSTMGIILYELLNNSVKHAFGEGDRGQVTVGVSRRDGRMLLEYTDDGPGFPDPSTVIECHGFGMRLVGLLTEQLGGTLELDGSDGARFVIAFPG